MPGDLRRSEHGNVAHFAVIGLRGARAGNVAMLGPHDAPSYRRSETPNRNIERPRRGLKGTPRTMPMNQTPYRYGLLDPRPGRDAANAGLLGPHTLGIEVTVPALAAACGLGNIDPQHGTAASDIAAIEACLVAPVPPANATLVTIRPDLDALGGMAVLSLRRRGTRLSADCLNRVGQIARADRHARGPWPGPRPFPASCGLDHPECGVSAMAAAAADLKPSMDARVLRIARWLVAGIEPEGYGESVARERAALAQAHAAGDLSVQPRAAGRIAVVVSTHRAAVACAYCTAPVVVALNPAFTFGSGRPHRKFTICQWQPGHVDLAAACAALAALEPGWGGSATIVGSPQGSGSTLSVDTVLAVAESCLMSSPAVLQNVTEEDRARDRVRKPSP